MGLFSNKAKPCPICGKPTPRLLATKVEGVPICGDCTLPIMADSEVQDQWTMDDLREHLRYREENKQRVESFRATRTVDCGREMQIDDGSRCFYMKQWSEDNPPIFSFEAILGFELTMGWEVVERWSRGMPRVPFQAPQLGVFGTLAALGNAFDRDRDEHRHSKSESLSIHLLLNDPYLKRYELMDESVFGTDELEFGRRFAVELSRVNAVCDIIASMAGWTATTPQANPVPSVDRTADDIKKFKDIFDAGVITQEEFEAKKKQLLGI